MVRNLTSFIFIIHISYEIVFTPLLDITSLVCRINKYTIFIILTIIINIITNVKQLHLEVEAVRIQSKPIKPTQRIQHKAYI